MEENANKMHFNNNSSSSSSSNNNNKRVLVVPDAAEYWTPCETVWMVLGDTSSTYYVPIMQNNRTLLSFITQVFSPKFNWLRRPADFIRSFMFISFLFSIFFVNSVLVLLTCYLFSYGYLPVGFHDHEHM